MSRRFTLVTVALTAVVAFLVGAIVAGGGSAVRRDGRNAASAPRGHPRRVAATPPSRPPLVNFADVVERINPAVVNIDATSQGTGDGRRRRAGEPNAPDRFDRPEQRGDNAAPRGGQRLHHRSPTAAS